ncbi:hypothetical protein RAC83_002099, partial [Xylella fastidiosa]|uniref:hypothetical protein n=1 Tax=Xylella fastidiosa TaxID=2371 RepID=UPI0028803A29
GDGDGDGGNFGGRPWHRLHTLGGCVVVFCAVWDGQSFFSRLLVFCLGWVIVLASGLILFFGGTVVWRLGVSDVVVLVMGSVVT